MDQMPDTFPSLFWAYNAFWLIIAVYVFSLVRRVEKLEKENRKTE